ncbi:hypothetical protein CLV88_106146 [Shimia abyssi]|uniref:Uncharacterized protein n=1 Tax=Shimia abyssi TaxID=1662395 RepID=A0A2P8FCI4_9RHOB|nr:hypothetical protein CLV88_106146 [Shimia abyssi]
MGACAKFNFDYRIFPQKLTAFAERPPRGILAKSALNIAHREIIIDKATNFDRCGGTQARKFRVFSIASAQPDFL